MSGQPSTAEQVLRQEAGAGKHHQLCLIPPELNLPPRSRGRVDCSLWQYRVFAELLKIDWLMCSGLTCSYLQDPEQLLSRFSLLPFWVVLLWVGFFSDGRDSAFPCCSLSFLVSE